MPDEGSLLSEHPVSQDRSQRLRIARDVAREVGKTEAYKQSRKDRKKVEMLFAHSSES